MNIKNNNIVRKIHYFYKYYIYQSSIPQYLQVELTNHCNFHCRMCYHDNMKRDKGFMSLDLFKRIVDEAVRIGISWIRPQFAGESMLHPCFIEMIRYAKDAGLRVEFSTNGFLLDKKTGSMLIDAGVDRVYFSFHGGSQSEFRVVHGVDGYHQCLKNIIDFCDLKKDKGVFLPLVSIRAMRCSLNKKHIDMVPSLFDSVYDFVFRFNTCQFNPVTMKEDCRVDKVNVDRGFPCYRLFDRLVVLWDGRVTVCCVDNEGLLVVGCVDDGLLDVFHGDRLNRLRYLHLKGKYPLLCQGCMI